MADYQKYFNFVIALCGPYGAGCSSLANEMIRVINDMPCCHVQKIKVSDLIKGTYKEFFGEKIKHSNPEPPFIRETLQKAGNELRADDNMFVGKIIAANLSAKAKNFEKAKHEAGENDIFSHFFIVDSLKNRNDYIALKEIFKEELFLIFVHANAETRWQRMLNYKFWYEKHRAKFFELDKIDSSEKDSDSEVGNAGQEVRKISPLADYYVVNSYKDLDELRGQSVISQKVVVIFKISWTPSSHCAMRTMYEREINTPNGPSGKPVSTG
jgi:hypothetical protein